MATTNQPAPNQPTDPAQLGADQSPETSRADDSRDMSPVLAESDKDQSPDTGSRPAGPAQGSAFDHQRQQGAAGDGRPNSDVGQGQGMGRAGYNGDEDRGYDQSPHRGGLGSSGGRESHADRQPATDTNPFTGTSTDQPRPEQTKNLGLDTPSPVAKPE